MLCLQYKAPIMFESHMTSNHEHYHVTMLSWVLFYTFFSLDKTDKVCDLTLSCMKKYRKFHLIVSLWSHFEIHNNNQPFSSMWQSKSIRKVRQKPDNNCQITRILTKSFIQFIWLTRYLHKMPTPHSLLTVE